MGPSHAGRRRRRGGRARHRSVQPGDPHPAFPDRRRRLLVAPQRRPEGRSSPPGGRGGRGHAGPGHGGLAHARLPGLRPGLRASCRRSGRRRGDPGPGTHRPPDVRGGPRRHRAHRDRVWPAHPGGGMVGTLAAGPAPLARHVAAGADSAGPDRGATVGGSAARLALVPAEGPNPPPGHPAVSDPPGPGWCRAARATTVGAAAPDGLATGRSAAEADGGRHAGCDRAPAGGGASPRGAGPRHLRLRSAAYSVRDPAH